MMSLNRDKWPEAPSQHDHMRIFTTLALPMDSASAQTEFRIVMEAQKFIVVQSVRNKALL
jgi:hypothetical protein